MARLNKIFWGLLSVAVDIVKKITIQLKKTLRSILTKYPYEVSLRSILTKYRGGLVKVSLLGLVLISYEGLVLVIVGLVKVSFEGGAGGSGGGTY